MTRRSRVANRQLLEELLASRRIADKGRGHQIGKHFGIVKIGEIVIDFLWELTAASFELRVEIEDFGTKRLGCEGRNLRVPIRAARFRRLGMVLSGGTRQSERVADPGG